MAPHSSTLAWKIPWMEEPGGLQSMGSLRVRHDWVTSLSLVLSCIGEGNGNPLQCSCLENPRDGGAWWAAVYEVAQSRTWLKRLSSSSKHTFSLGLWPWSFLRLEHFSTQPHACSQCLKYSFLWQQHHVSRIYSNVTTQRGFLLLLAKQLFHPPSLTPLPTDPHFLYHTCFSSRQSTF